MNTVYPPMRMSTRQKIILLLLLGAQFMLSVDFSILNVALPDIGKGLHFSLSNLQWVATAFSLTAAGFTLLFGRIADIVGRRRMFMAGIGLLGISSLVGGLAQTQTLLLLARTAQGLATAMVTPAALALITTMFKEGPERDKALGLNGALLSAGFTTGSIAGGVLTSLLNWRWAFFINVPVALAIFIGIPAYITESRDTGTKHLDAPGAITVTAGLLALVYGLTEFGVTGFTHPLTSAALVAALVLLIAFWLIERRSKLPLISLTTLRKPTVRYGNLGGFITFTMETSLIFLTTLYLQKVLGYSPLATGLSFGSLGVAAFLTGILGPRYIERIGSKKTLVWGLLGQALLTIFLVLVGQQHGMGIVLVIVATTLGAIGHMTALVSYMITANSGIAAHERGAASGIISMTQLVGISLGIPVMSTIANARIHALSHTPAKAAILQGYRLAVLVNALIVLVGVFVIQWGLKHHKNVAASLPKMLAEES